jgi:hypothetical protein
MVTCWSGELDLARPWLGRLCRMLGDSSRRRDLKDGKEYGFTS